MNWYEDNPNVAGDVYMNNNGTVYHTDTTNWHQNNQDLIDDANLSKAVYSMQENVRDWKIDKTLSNENRAVYHNHRTGKAKVAFRGTKPSNVRDLGTDLLIGLGLQDVSSRFKNAVRTTDLAIAKYGKENVSLTGHSLGAAQSAYVSRKRGLKATGFNTPWSKADEMRNRTYSHFHSIQTTTDPISVRTARIGKVGKKTWTKSKSWNPHALSNWI